MKFNKFNPHLSVSIKFLIYQLVGLGLIVAVIGLFQYQNVRNGLYAKVETSGKNLLQMMEDVLAEQPELLNTAHLQPIVLRFTTKIPDVHRVSVVDQSLQIIADSDPRLVGQRSDQNTLIELIREDREERAYYLQDGQRFYRLSRPLKGIYDSQSKSNIIGVLSIDMQVSPTDEQIRRDFSQIMLIIGSMMFIFGLVLYLLTHRSFVRPLLNLTAATEAFGRGDFSARAAVTTGGDYLQTVEVTTTDEIGRLGNAFNGMTLQLRELINSLEQRVADRTHRLEIVATLGEQLNAILDPNELLREVVNQTKQNFGYYHAQIYLLDDRQGNLTVVEGTGEAGVEMKRSNHSIPLNAPTSLVAQAARMGEIIMVDNVREAEDWLPNPLLPDIYSEMAVPITAEGRVVGVLDVQEDTIGGLDDGDANLLRSLANQVAVALTNAHLFEQTTQAKEAAEQAREAAEAANHTLERQVWQTTGQAQLSNKMRGEQDIPTLADSIMHQLCHYLRAQIGALYVVEEDSLTLVGRYAYNSKKTTQQFKFGEGLVGQAALEKQPMLVTDVPRNYITVRSGLGETVPRNIMLFPFMYEDQVVGVIELGTLTEFTQAEMEFIQMALDNIAIAFNTAQARARIDELLTQTQRQAEELQAQEEELRVANEELEAQTKSLRASETKLKEQQTELEATNTQLEEQASALEESSHILQKQQVILDNQNQELKAAQQELKKQAEELALTSKYKSEFLANMSHELRTPLNSLLILARMLADNEEGNLTDDQVESAQIIYSGGKDLLTLINDILDLAKVESGKLTFTFETMPLSDLTAMAQAQFAHIAEEKGLELNLTLAEDLPDTIDTDPQRVKQIVKNLLSNAFKFTSQGNVSLTIQRPAAQIDLSQSGLDPSQAIAISVTDTGVGMTAEQQKIIFEAFQQADSGTSRRYGGTGLGLSISRELAIKLGGQIDVESEADQGSTFTLYLPIHKPDDVSDAQAQTEQPTQTIRNQPTPDPTPVLSPSAGRPAPQPAFPDDRAELKAGDKLLLVIEDDPRFAKILSDFAHKKGFKCLVAADGKSGLELVRTYQPQAITLDLNLPDINGWAVLESLKNDPATRHIPVHVISADEEDLDAFRKGAIGYLTKPVSQEALADSFQKIEDFNARQIKDLLLVENDDASRQNIKKLLGGSDLRITEADRGQTALELLHIQQFDCMILDLSLPDMSGFDFLNQMNGHKPTARCPIIVYTGHDLTAQENLELRQFADSVIVKGVKSPERLLDETALFLHRVVADMPEDKQRTIKQLYDQEAHLKDKKVLIVDDDLRNAFALSKLLSDKGLIVKLAQDGQNALDLLAQEAVDLVLMDIMMPVMDGYETMQRIRTQPEFKTLPILALTAKAMQGDREKCLAAGANDYLSKPVDIDQLFSMLRVWLYQ